MCQLFTKLFVRKKVSYQNLLNMLRYKRKKKLEHQNLVLIHKYYLITIRGL
jgi:hypothetical protein